LSRARARKHAAAEGPPSKYLGFSNSSGKTSAIRAIVITFCLSTESIVALAKNGCVCGLTATARIQVKYLQNFFNCFLSDCNGMYPKKTMMK
jgi:hypothetical protein